MDMNAPNTNKGMHTTTQIPQTQPPFQELQAGFEMGNVKLLEANVKTNKV